MSLTTCTVHIAQRQEKSVYATAPFLKALGMSGTRNARFTLGSQSVIAPVKLWKRSGRHIQFPGAIAGDLGIPFAGSCLAVTRGKNEIRIGPLIGILTASATGSLSAPFGGRGGFLKQIAGAGRGRSFCFAFSPRDVNWEQETVTGYFPQKSGAWLRRTVPLPDVVYNRLPDRRAERQSSMDNFKERFVRKGVTLFNWSFFDKWDVYKLLQGDPASKYVPESLVDPTPKEIQELMEKHKFVYFKPTGGSLGIGIYRLTYHPERGYFARYRKDKKNVLIRFPRFEGLMNMLNRHHRGRLHHYVVQQGIRLIEIDCCPIDFRFHMIKNGDNRWVVAGIGAKKAGRGSVTTHIRNGGQLMTPEQVMNAVFGSRGGQVLQNAKSVAVELAEAIEKNYAHTLGELGFDIGIDQSERIWMFEANAKPGRTIFKHPSLKTQGKAAFVNLIDHCLYLSKFRPGREGA